MDRNEFLKNINQDEDLEVKEEVKDGCIILNKKLNRKYKIDNGTILDNDWQNIYSVLCGRESIIMDGITRVVGYFSKISNWNKSKVGELEDRRKGDYKIENKGEKNDCGTK